VATVRAAVEVGKKREDEKERGGGRKERETGG